MRHEQPTDEIQERAALYALGVLDRAEAAVFEKHLAEGCAACQQEARAFAEVAGHLAHAALARPRPGVRDRLLAQARTVSAVPTIVRAAECVWEAGPVAGVVVRPLFRDPGTRRLTALGRMEAGVAYPTHRHAETEELYMLEGDLTMEGQVLQAGDYCAATAGTVHHVTSTRTGCTFLLHASERDSAIDQAAPTLPQLGLIFVRASEAVWTPGPTKSVTQRTLLTDRARGTWTGLVRLDPGARLPGHQHRTADQFYMLEGDAHVAGQVLYPGDYYRAPAGTAYDVTHTESGCLFLLVCSKIEVCA